MEHIPQLITDLALILAVAGITTLICKILKQPLVLGYVVAGFLVSPAIGFFPSVGDTTSVTTWAEIGVIFLMFGLGLEFSFTKLAVIGKSAITTAAIEMSFMILFGFGIGSLLGWSFFNSIFLGGMLAISSTTIIIKAFDDLGLKGKKFATFVFGALVMEDIGAIFMMVVLSTIAVGTSVDGAQVAIRLGLMALYLVVWFTLSITIIPTLLRKASKSLTDEILLILSIALCFAMVNLAHAIGFSSALGAFLAGSILAGTTRAYCVERLFKPVKDLFGAVFFVSVGMLVAPSAIVDNAGIIVIVALVTLVGKPLASALGALFSKQDLKTSLQTGLSLSQIGEFSFIIAALGISLGVTDGFLYPVIIAVSVITTLTTPFYIKHADKVYAVMIKVLPNSFIEYIDRRSKTKEKLKESSLWGNYIKRGLIKTLMVVIIAVAMVEISKEVLKPFMLGVMPAVVADQILSAFCLVVTGIFSANLFQGTRKEDIRQLWEESKSHHAPLIALNILGFFITVAVVVYVALAFEEGSLFWLIPALVITIFLARSKRLRSLFLQVETRFVGNLNEKILEEKTEGHSAEDRIEWAEDRLFVTEVRITKITKRRGNPVPAVLYIARACNLNLIAVKRGGSALYEKELAFLTRDRLKERLDDVRDPLSIEKNDSVAFVGTEEEIDAFRKIMIKAGASHSEDAGKMMLPNYLKDEPSCKDLVNFALRIDVKSVFQGKTIEGINFKQEYGCLVIALERNLLPVIKPNKNTRLLRGDLLILLGPRRMADYFKGAAEELLVTPLATAKFDQVDEEVSTLKET